MLQAPNVRLYLDTIEHEAPGLDLTWDRAILAGYLAAQDAREGGWTAIVPSLPSRSTSTSSTPSLRRRWRSSPPSGPRARWTSSPGRVRARSDRTPYGALLRARIGIAPACRCALAPFFQDTTARPVASPRAPSPNRHSKSLRARVTGFRSRPAIAALSGATAVEGFLPGAG